MKRIAYLLSIGLALTGCTAPKIIELGGKTAIKGTEVSQKALDVFTIIGQQAYIEKAQEDKIKVLTRPADANMSLPNTKLVDFSQQLLPRVKAYQSLLKAYKQFSALTDAKYSDRTEEAVSALKESYNTIQSLPDLPAEISSKLPALSNMIGKSIQAKKIKTHNEILFTLTEVYISLWEQDQKTWNSYVDGIYDKYAFALDHVSAKNYDGKKIAKYFPEPYNDDAILVMMYRLELRDQVFKEKVLIKKQLNDFAKALRELNKLHLEISKENTDVASITQLLNSIENILTKS